MNCRGGCLEKLRGIWVPVGGLILVERQVGCSDPLTGLALPEENSPLGCQGNNSGLYLLNPLLSLLRLCCAEPSWLPHHNLQRCYSVSVI